MVKIKIVIVKIKPVKECNVSAIRTPALFLGIGTPNRRANVGAMSTWITKIRGHQKSS